MATIYGTDQSEIINKADGVTEGDDTIFGLEGNDDIIAFGEALAFQTTVGRKAIEQRSRTLAQQLMAGLTRLDGVRLWTNPAADRSAAVVSFQPGSLDARKLAQSLYEKDRIGITTRAGEDRPGLRVSPHFFNTPEEVDRLLGALSGYLRTSV